MIYEYLLNHNLNYFRRDNTQLINRIDHWLLDSKHFSPKDRRTGLRIKLNPQKFENWCRFATYLGILVNNQHETKWFALNFPYEIALRILANLNKQEKEWTVTAIKALAKLRPIIEEAEAKQAQTIKIKVTRVGEGKKTMYAIKQTSGWD